VNKRQKKSCHAKGNAIRLVDEKEYKMDYSQLKRMAEDRTERRR